MKIAFSLVFCFFIESIAWSQPSFTTDYYFRLFDKTGRIVTGRDFENRSAQIYVGRNSYQVLFTGLDSQAALKPAQQDGFYLRLTTVVPLTAFTIILGLDTLVTFLPSDAVDVVIDSLVIHNIICVDNFVLNEGGGKFNCVPKQKGCKLTLSGCSWYKADFNFHYLKSNECLVNFKSPGRFSFYRSLAQAINQSKELKWCSE